MQHFTTEGSNLVSSGVLRHKSNSASNEAIVSKFLALVSLTASRPLSTRGFCVTRPLTSTKLLCLQRSTCKQSTENCFTNSAAKTHELWSINLHFIKNNLVTITYFYVVGHYHLKDLEPVLYILDALPDVNQQCQCTRCDLFTIK